MPGVVILVPGILGSVLKLGDEEIWPGPLLSLWFPYNNMEALMREDPVATDCIRKYFITTQYQHLIDDLETCGFHEADKTLVVAAYDWRKDNANSAETLAQHIDDAVTLHGSSTEITIIAHSMGGLVSRHYLESGRFTGRLGFGRVRQLITLATPHRGAALALPLVLGYERRLFLNKDQVLQLSRDPRYPSGYQLLPHRGEPFAWDTPASQLEPLDIYTDDIANRLGLVPDNLRAAQAFHDTLNIDARPTSVRYFCFAGTRQTTAAQVLLRPRGPGQLDAVKVELEDGGDGTVPTWSATTGRLQCMYVGGEHSTIYQDAKLRRTLDALLGRAGRLAGIPQQVQVTLRDKVLLPQDDVHVLINFGQPINDFSGVITIEKGRIDARDARVTDFGKPTSVLPIQYKGLSMETTSLVFPAPDYPGVYRVSLRNDPEADPSGYDELIIQQIS